MRRAVLAAVGAAIVVLAAAGCGHGGKKDLRELVRLKAVPSPGHKVTDEDLDRSAEIIRRRLDKLGIDGEVDKQGRDMIVVRVPPAVMPRNPATAKALIGRTGLLEFYDFEAHLAGPSARGLNQEPVAAPSVTALLSDPATRALAKRGTPTGWYVHNRRRLAVPHGTVVVKCKVTAGNCLSVRQVTGPDAYYLFETPAEMTGRDLDPSGTRADTDPSTNQPVVVVQFTDRGKRVFHDITRREAQRGALICQGQHDASAVLRCAQHFAIVLDHEIVSVPYIDFARNPDGISGDNGAQIDLGGAGSLQEAKRIAIALQSGALPVQFVRVR